VGKRNKKCREHNEVKQMLTGGCTSEQRNSILTIAPTASIPQLERTCGLRRWLPSRKVHGESMGSVSEEATTFTQLLQLKTNTERPETGAGIAR
jgi:hypothetical protein